MSYAQTRLPYEFEHKIKYEALRSASECEICRLPELITDPFECNHIIAIWFAREVPCLTVEVIRSIANMQVIHKSCHKELHTRESRRYYQELVPFVVARYLSMMVDHTRDSWRASYMG